jgi:hypothetical protein
LASADALSVNVFDADTVGAANLAARFGGLEALAARTVAQQHGDRTYRRHDRYAES